jgi:hypothetical protein
MAICGSSGFAQICADHGSEDREDAEYRGGWLIGFLEAWAQASIVFLLSRRLRF